MMKTCKVQVEVWVDDTCIRHKTWPECDIMNTSRTRAWATRQFNRTLNDLASCLAGKDKIVSVCWTAIYPDKSGRGRIHGRLSGVNGKKLVRNGIFED